MPRLYTDRKGRVSPVPQSRKDALKYRKDIYETSEICTKCDKPLTKFVKSGNCFHCRMLLSIDFFNYAIGIAEIATYKDTHYLIHNGRKFNYRIITDIEYDEIKEAMKLFPLKFNAPISRERAIEQQSDNIVTTQVCRNNGHLGVRTLSTASCYYCDHEPPILTAKQQAKINNEEFYTPINPCKVCSQSLRATKTGICMICNPPSTATTTNPKQEAISNNEEFYVPINPCRVCSQSLRATKTGICMICNPPNTKPRQQALTNGDDYYMPNKDCKKCGLRSNRVTKTASCTTCNVPSAMKPKSARQNAIKNKEKWYTPETTCTNCNTFALRRVNNSTCSRCG